MRAGGRGGDAVESVRSLGYRTDLSLLLSAGSTVVDRGDHLVVRTGDNRDFWWGNFLLLRTGLSAEQAPEWVARFERELPWAAHRAFGLDDPDAPVEAFSAFADIGYQVERNAVMTARSVQRTRYPAPDATCRPLVGDSDWRQHLDVSRLVYPDPQDDSARAFARERAVSRRKAVEAGHGVWVGAFVDGRLVSQLGVMRAGRGLGRYQNVETRPDFRRRGLAAALVRLGGQIMLSSFGVHTLVMVADPDDEAIRLYRSLGFAESEHQLEACRSPR